MEDMDNNNVQTWRCGAGNTGNVIATLKGTTLTVSGIGKMENYSNKRIINRLQYEVNSYKNQVSPEYIEEKLGIIAAEKAKKEKAPWYGSSITNVVIEHGVTNIGSCAFADCYALISVIISDSVISIEDGAFERCTALTSLIIPNNVNYLGKDILWDCVSLVSIINESLAPQVTNGNPFQYDYKNALFSRAELFVLPSLIHIYKVAPVWNNFRTIKNISIENNTPEQIDEQVSAINKEIEELENKREELLLQKVLMRDLKGNPKHVADFMSLFNQRDELKYLTHDFDENNEFDYESFLSQIKKVCTENLGQLEIPKTLIDLLNQFAFENNPKWTAFDKQFNPKEITSGWSSPEWEEAKNNKLHPIKHPEFAEIIKDFKRTTRIESPNLETITNKIFADETFEIEKKGLSKADFYTHVGEFKSALETIFEEIQKRSDTDDKKKVSIEYKKETCDDYFIRKVIITHHNSFPTRDDEDSLVKEWLSLDKGNMGKIAGHLQGYCHWSVITRINDKPLKVNILREKETPVQEESEASEAGGFTHVLTFYYQS